IALGLFAGKLAGVFGFTWMAVRFGFGTLPSAADWRHMLGIALLTGIGFTMSLFLGALAFPDEELHRHIRVGVLAGSSCAAIGGALWLRMRPRSHSRETVPSQTSR